MSFETLYYDCTIVKEDLLDLFLGQGNLPFRRQKQYPIFIKEFSDRHGVREVDGVTIHEAKIRGISTDPNLSSVDGKVTLTPTNHGEWFNCEFELHLHDHCE